ncbi:MAG: DUF4177 domain-containing protein [Chlorobi bacterium]|nr:DUF4177 domain-containing protein [Chlorobiota bacterium]
MKEYKVLKIKKSFFKSDLDRKIQEALDRHARMGWELAEMSLHALSDTVYLVLSRKSVKH